MITFVAPLAMVMHGPVPLVRVIHNPLIVCPEVTVIGPELVKLVIRGPTVQALPVAVTPVAWICPVLWLPATVLPKL